MTEDKYIDFKIETTQVALSPTDSLNDFLIEGWQVAKANGQGHFILVRCRHKLSDVKKLIEEIEDNDGA